MTLVKDYSGVVLDQNQPPALDTDNANVGSSWIYQGFYLPDNYQRGTNSNELSIPPLSGFQILVGIDEGYSSTATLDYTLDYYNLTWNNLTTGTTIQAHMDGDKVWMDIYFDNPVNIGSDIIDFQFRFGIRGRAVSGSTIKMPIEWDGSTAIVYENIITPVLTPQVPYSLTVDGDQGFLLLDPSDNTVTWSLQQGVNKVWYTAPNPIIGQANDGTNPLERSYEDPQPVSLNFRLLGLIADEGIDFLGNPYRSSVELNSADAVNTFDSSSIDYWMSEPLPSEFAVVSKYFDMGEESIVTQVLIDPITPGVDMNIYYSDDGDSVQTEDEWESKVWTHVDRIFHVTQRQTFELPIPIVARFLKLEFSNLQAKSYTPGEFQKPVQYKKFPKWVLDWFLAHNPMQTSDLTVNSVGVVFDSLDLAYNYYLDDIHETPETPATLVGSTSALNKFLLDNSDLSDQVDPTTLANINAMWNIYQTPIADISDPNTGSGTQALINNYMTDYPVEQFNFVPSNPIEVSTQNRAPALLEKSFPTMYFFVPCRHRYRVLQTTFTYNKAYYVGMREISFVRQNYTVPQDTPIYTELGYDSVNISNNEFTRTGNVLTV